MSDIDPTIEFDKTNSAERKRALARLDQVKFTPVEGQVAFIKELVKNPEEARRFASDAKGYAVSHGILLDPAVVEKLTRQVMFDVALDEDFVRAAGPHIAKDLVDLRNRRKFGEPSLPSPVPLPRPEPGPIPRPQPGPDPMPMAVPAVVAAAAAVVVAAVEVVTMVVTLVRTSRPADLVSLQGLSDHGILLPGGSPFVDRTGLPGGIQLPGLARGGGFIR